MSENACALWYLRYQRMDYDLFDSEAEAARYAAYLDDEGEGSPVGAQFPDGRTIEAEGWPALAEAKQRLRQAEQDRRDNPPPPIPTRTVRDPFEGREVQVEVSEPDWIGR